MPRVIRSLPIVTRSSFRTIRELQLLTRTPRSWHARRERCTCEGGGTDRDFRHGAGSRSCRLRENRKRAFSGQAHRRGRRPAYIHILQSGCLIAVVLQHRTRPGILGTCHPSRSRSITRTDRGIHPAWRPRFATAFGRRRGNDSRSARATATSGKWDQSFR